MKTFFIATEFEAAYFIDGLQKISNSLYEGKHRVIISGPGLVNMAAAVGKAAQTYSEDTFINVGIAGAYADLNIGDIKEVKRFFVIEPALPENSRKIWEMSYPKIETGSGTALSTSLAPVWNAEEISTTLGDLVDMEGYAFAKSCIENGIDFKCYKTVSDRLKKNSHAEFLTNARTALKKLQKYILENVLKA